MIKLCTCNWPYKAIKKTPSFTVMWVQTTNMQEWQRKELFDYHNV